MSLSNTLKKLQDDSWNVIVLCDQESCPSEFWMPVHRLLFTDYHRFTTKMYLHQHLADLTNLIKNPDYNRYQFSQSLPMSKHLFNETCLKDIEEIHIKTFHLTDAYLPPAMWVTKNVNERRKRLNKEPLEIVFHSRNLVKSFADYATFIENQSNHIRFSDYGQNKVIAPEIIYVRVIEFDCNYKPHLFTPKEKMYKMKDVECPFVDDSDTMESFDELFELINRDICADN
uniref:Uncharacterized protein n=1 Tax=Clytia hemisphaerica TaxID=252671 RepID=A0A7M5V4B5_9CNID